MPDILVTPIAPSHAVTGLQIACIGCGSNVCPKGFVNFRTLAEDDMRVACVDCFLDMSRQLGCLTPDQAANLTQRLAAGQNTITQLQGELDALKLKHLHTAEEVKDLLGSFGIKPPKEEKVALRSS